MRRLLSIALALLLLLPMVRNGTVQAQDSRFYATFLQNWMCRDWTAERWEEEFAHARNAGFRAIILQSVCDIVRGEPSGDPQDPAGYPAATSFCMYPSAIPALAGAYRSSQNSGDALALALEAAKATGMQLWIGTVNDDLWWKYGWGLPASGGQTGTLFGDWCAENLALTAALISEINERYGETYAAQIGGFYYTNEIWNIDAACLGTDDGYYAQTIGENICTVREALEAAFPDKPLLISPFWNPTLCTPEQFCAFLHDLVDAAAFRPIDIYAPQDGGGAERDPELLRIWAAAQWDAVGEQMRFWLNCETFNADSSPKPISALRQNYQATSDLAEGAIVFSWNHYYAADAALDASFSAFSAVMQGDVNGDERVDLLDVVLLTQYLHGLQPLRFSDASDLNDDGVCDIFDLALLKRRVLAQA